MNADDERPANEAPGSAWPAWAGPERRREWTQYIPSYVPCQIGTHEILRCEMQRKVVKNVEIVKQGWVPADGLCRVLPDALDFFLPRCYTCPYMMRLEVGEPAGPLVVVPRPSLAINADAHVFWF